MNLICSIWKHDYKLVDKNVQGIEPKHERNKLWFIVDLYSCKRCGKLVTHWEGNPGLFWEVERILNHDAA